MCSSSVSLVIASNCPGMEKLQMSFHQVGATARRSNFPLLDCSMHGESVASNPERGVVLALEAN